MIGKLHVENFRSIQKADVEFGPITVFYGPTASGKSSLLYSLLVLRNFVLNPNQPVDGLFGFGFQGLGGFEPCIFNHEASETIAIEAEFNDLAETCSYGLNLRKSDCDIKARYGLLELQGKAAMPYPGNQSWQTDFLFDDADYSVNWNGFAASITPKAESPEAPAKARALTENLNFSAESVKRIDICPHTRGFTKPYHVQVPVSPAPTSEDEIATLIINDQFAAGRISADTIEIFGREFRLHTPPGTAMTYLQTTEVAGARVPGLLVNDGFGVNQVVYMLAKFHRPGIKTILVEEPEVHLHPTVVRKFARLVTRLAAEDSKQLIFTTHSGQFLLSLLTCVKEGLLEPDQLACFYVDRERRKTLFKRETVTKNGQASEGLSAFMGAELEDIKSFISHEK